MVSPAAVDPLICLPHPPPQSYELDLGLSVDAHLAATGDVLLLAHPALHLLLHPSLRLQKGQCLQLRLDWTSTVDPSRTVFGSRRSWILFIWATLSAAILFQDLWKRGHTMSGDPKVRSDNQNLDESDLAPE